MRWPSYQLRSLDVTLGVTKVLGISHCLKRVSYKILRAKCSNNLMYYLKQQATSKFKSNEPVLLDIELITD